MGCEIRSSIAVHEVSRDDEGRPVYAVEDALTADVVLLANRMKLHTDFDGRIESGLCKMAVISVSKQRGADAAHNAALASSFREVIPERTAVLVEETSIGGGVAVIENANEGVKVKRLLNCEPELLELAEELQPILPIDDLDLLVPDEIGKNVSDIGMDTNVAGRMRHGKPEPTFIDRPNPRARPDRRDARQRQRDRAGRLLLPAGCQARRRDHHLCNSVTGGQPERGAMPLAVLSTGSHCSSPTPRWVSRHFRKCRSPGF